MTILPKLKLGRSGAAAGEKEGKGVGEITSWDLKINKVAVCCTSPSSLELGQIYANFLWTLAHQSHRRWGVGGTRSSLRSLQYCSGDMKLAVIKMLLAAGASALTTFEGMSALELAAAAAADPGALESPDALKIAMMLLSGCEGEI